ncbi:MAG: recombinase RecT [Eubacterium sp.]|nr:recombinase RecT [Eubacterium sp.]
MKTTNTAGVITKAAQTQVAKTEKPKNPMEALLNHSSTIETLQKALKENAGAYAASILDLYNSDTYLRQCEPKQVFGECLKAVSLKLPINKQLGFAYIVPYRDKSGKQTPQFQIGYKGLLQLCQRTGMYKYINADVVYEGEFQGLNKLTGELDLTGEKISDKVVGYFAYIETLNGFSHGKYMTAEAVVAHAKRFSKSYNSSSSAWKTDFDSMAIKTVLRLLLSHYGYMSVGMMNAFNAEDTNENNNVIETTIEPIEETVIEAEAVIADAEPTTPETPTTEDEPYPFGDAE